MKYTDHTDRRDADKVCVICTQREMMDSKAYQSGNWEIVKEHIAPAPGDGGAHLYAIRAGDVSPGEWIYNEAATTSPQKQPINP